MLITWGVPKRMPPLGHPQIADTHKLPQHPTLPRQARALLQEAEGHRLGAPRVTYVLRCNEDLDILGPYCCVVSSTSSAFTVCL